MATEKDRDKDPHRSKFFERGSPWTSASSLQGLFRRFLTTFFIQAVSNYPE